jgi:hypothetical protein
MTTSPVTTITDGLLAEIEADYLDAASVRADRDECLMIAAIITELRALRAENAALAKDAGRYRWLRETSWYDSQICAVRDPAKQVKPGSDCPSRHRLDLVIDSLMQEPTQ